MRAAQDFSIAVWAAREQGGLSRLRALLLGLLLSKDAASRKNQNHYKRYEFHVGSFSH
jgi:hypothetical protein